jgi:hypothetical protein
VRLRPASLPAERRSSGMHNCPPHALSSHVRHLIGKPAVEPVQSPDADGPLTGGIVHTIIWGIFLAPQPIVTANVYAVPCARVAALFTHPDAGQ